MERTSLATLLQAPLQLHHAPPLAHARRRTAPPQHGPLPAMDRAARTTRSPLAAALGENPSNDSARVLDHVEHHALRRRDPAEPSDPRNILHRQTQLAAK